MSVIKKEKSVEKLDKFEKIYAITYDGYVQSFLNPISLEEQGVNESSQQFEELKNAELTELKIFQKMEITTNETHLIKLDHLYIKNKFNLQKLWNLNDNENLHKFWEAPNCQCNKEENENKYPNGNYSISDNCLIHRHRKIKIT